MRISDWSSDVCSSDLRKVLGESLARGSPLSSSRFAALAPFYTRRAQWAFSVIGGITRPVTRSLLLGLLRSEEHTSELQSLMRISYAVFCLKKKINHKIKNKDRIKKSLNQTHQ